MGIQLPSIITVDDYHEIDPFIETINQIRAAAEIKGEEINLDTVFKLRDVSERLDDFPGYLGLIYTGRRPKREIVLALLEKHLNVNREDLKY